MKKIKGGLQAVSGFLTAGVACNIRKKDTKDVAIIFSETLCSVAGVYTKNIIKAAPVLWCKKITSRGTANAIVVNSGNANACTGTQGFKNCEEMARIAGECLKIPKSKVLVCSTGIIGEPLPMDRVKSGIENGCSALSPNNGKDAAAAIMTTDKFPKSSAIEFSIGKRSYAIGGIAKGSGMIFPNMATMLSFIVTNVSISPALLKEALRNATNETFNMISVDGDRSTNDTVLVMANGAAGGPQICTNGKDYQSFYEALRTVCSDLATQIVLDGEGGTKIIEIKITGAKTVSSARKVATEIARSNLVKTAIFGEDPNWGRIVMAAGNAGVNLDFDRMDLFLGDVEVIKKGKITDPLWEKKVRSYFKEKNIKIHLNLNLGKDEATALTTDLTYEYIRINASYRT